LETLAMSHDTQKKAVSISFAGEGDREVVVGYVIENPIWKTSYRLVLNKEGKPFLQGWAIVENPSDEDWNGVGMVLVSGRPISFQMDLYQPLYVPRPVVVPELFASLRPPTHEGRLTHDPARVPPPMAVQDASKHQDQAFEKLKEKKVGAFDRLGDDADEASVFDPSQGIRTAATAGQLGDFFKYEIDQPVSLARQKSAMLPIVNKDIEGSRVSIYNQNTHVKFPLLGLKFKNTSGLHLMQGPITVFEGATYAGDARVLDVQPNEERIISYAVDLGTEVSPVVDNPRHVLNKVKVLKGIVYTTTRVMESKTYKVANRSEQDRTVLIEHPFRGDFKITSKEQPVETTRDVHRFQVKLAAHKDASLTVVEEKDDISQVVLSNSDDNTIRQFVQTNVSSKAVQEALKKAMELKGKRDLTRQELANLDQQLQDIERDQKRIRDNMNQTPQGTELHKKYLDKLTVQETEVDKIRDTIKAQRADELAQTKAYEAFLIGLDIE
jgi:hypothetical protein